MKNKNQFVIDLGDLKITQKQRAAINDAIERAVSKELVALKAKFKPIKIISGKPKLPFDFFPWGIVLPPSVPNGIWENVDINKLEKFQK